MRRSHWSLQSQNSVAYLSVALALVSVIPALSCVVIMLSLHTDQIPNDLLLQNGVAFFGVFSLMLGYSLLRVYPRNLVRLRTYIEQISNELFPETVSLIPSEFDIYQLETSLNKLIRKLQQRVEQLDAALRKSQEMLQTIEAQSEELMTAERQRVMIESLGAACHHIGQPTTVLFLYLTQLRDQDPETFEKQNLGPCLDAVEKIAEILRRLKATSEYRTVRYGSGRLSSREGSQSGEVDIQIVSIGDSASEAPSPPPSSGS